MEIQCSGSSVSINTGKHNIKASIISGYKTDSFLVFGGSKNSDLNFTIPFAVIPLHTANRLAQRYGNVFRCSSPGASEAKSSIRTLFLYPESPDVEKSIKKIDKLTKAGKDPVVEMTYVELAITDHKMKSFGQKVTVEYRGNTASCLVKKIQLIEEDRNL